jgi:hypothetical protein
MLIILALKYAKNQQPTAFLEGEVGDNVVKCKVV